MVFSKSIQRRLAHQRPDLNMYVVYEKPTDYPDEYVVRHWTIGPDGLCPGQIVARGKTLAEVVAEIEKLLPNGWYRLPPFVNDDPCIVEVWI